MPTYARRRKQMQDRGFRSKWEEEQHEKKVQRKLDEFTEEEDGQDN